MADSERMEAVKRAYAEIILNTAAESASRVLAAEKKSLGFRRALVAAKDEAVEMMVRLKSIMDAKIEEAEARSVFYIRRIQELESQLHESESTVLSLRAELEKERQKPSTTNPNPSPNGDATSMKNSPHTDDSCCSVRNLPETDQASISMRNGCTQRIRAFEQSANPKSDLIFGNNNDDNNNNKSENGDGVRFFSRRDLPRKSRTKCNYVKISKFGVKSEDLNLKMNSMREEREKCGEGGERENGSDLDLDLEAAAGLELIADNIGKEDDLPVTEESQELRTEGEKIQDNEGHISKVDSIDKVTPPIENSEPKNLETPKPSNEPETGTRFIKYTFQRKRKRESSDNTPETLIVENANNNTNTNNGHNINNSNNSDNNNKESNCNEEETEGKKESVIKNKKRGKKVIPSGEKKNLRPKKSLLTDSPRSNRRLVQVARQLISLSTKRW